MWGQGLILFLKLYESKFIYLKIHPFKAYSSEFLNIFNYTTVIADFSTFSSLPQKSILINSHFLVPLSPILPGHHYYSFVYIEFSVLDISFKCRWDGFFHLACFQVSPMLEHISVLCSFYGWMILCFINVPCFLYSFIIWRFGLFLRFTNYE